MGFYIFYALNRCLKTHSFVKKVSLRRLVS